MKEALVGEWQNNTSIIYDWSEQFEEKKPLQFASNRLVASFWFPNIHHCHMKWDEIVDTKRLLLVLVIFHIIEKSVSLYTFNSAPFSL
jgi:hypothetical protein